MKKNKDGAKVETTPQKSEEEKRIDRSEVYESKYVKDIIENFNHVLELIDEQERELKMFVSLQDDGNRTSDSEEEVESKPKVFKAKLNTTRQDIKNLFTKIKAKATPEKQLLSSAIKVKDEKIKNLMKQSQNDEENET